MLRPPAFAIILILVTIFVLKRAYKLPKEKDGKAYKKVKIDGGWVRGKEADDGDYLSFLGIPYAAPPTGKNRFKAPLPPLPWKEVFVANRTVNCPQLGTGDEDCLVVNVFTPKHISEAPLPVLVFIHGGSYVTGNGPTNGVQPLVSKNIVVVTINYRLGPLGFLCLGVEEAPGNAALKDQVEALKWVQRNIEYFGGDPGKVTLYGTSAGGTSVEYQIMSNLGRGLFQRAIVEDGTTNTVWATALDPVETAFEFASLLNFRSETRDLCKLVNFYQQVPANLLSLSNLLYIKQQYSGIIGFVPCVERKMNGTEPFIQEPPNTILTQERYQKVPMLYSFAALSGMLLTGSAELELSFINRINSILTDYVPGDLTFSSEEIKYAVTEEIKSIYFPNEQIKIVELLEYIGDAYILHGLLNTVQIQSKNNPVYLMEFAYKGKLGGDAKLYENITVAGHADMMGYVFLSKQIESEKDRLYVDLMSTLITNYVKYGNPNPKSSPLLPFVWPQTDPQNLPYLRVGEDLEILQRPNWERQLFWNSLYSKYRKCVKSAKSDVIGCN